MAPAEKLILAYAISCMSDSSFIYDCIIKALDTRMNTTIELAFSDAHIFEVFVAEFLIACARSGDYIDPRDVEAHLKPCRARDGLMEILTQQGIR